MGVQQYIVQTVALGGLGAAFYAAKALFQPEIDARVGARRMLAAREPNLAVLLTQLCRLGDDAGMEALLDVVDRIVEHDRCGDAASQWYIARLSADVAARTRGMCRAAVRDPALFAHSSYCSDEVLPQIDQQLMNLLHNHLLRRLR